MNFKGKTRLEDRGCITILPIARARLIHAFYRTIIIVLHSSGVSLFIYFSFSEVTRTNTHRPPYNVPL